MDDIVVMRAYKKLVAQISGFCYVGYRIRCKNKESFGVLAFMNSIIFECSFSIITFIILVNAFNLIDGIDGLAGSYGLICFGLLGLVTTD